MKEISMKELEVRQMLLPSCNWNYVRDMGANEKGQNIVLAKCGVCGTEINIPKSLFFRKICAVPCPGCRERIIKKALGLEVDKYRIIAVNSGKDPLTCTIECTNCGRLYYDVRLDYLVLRKYKVDLCTCKRLPKKDITPVYITKKEKSLWD